VIKVAKKRKKVEQRPTNQGNEALTLSDSLNDDILAKLKAAKKELTNIEQEKEVKHQEQLRHERKEREDNKSFEELLKEY